jgi:hypothetical protein
VDNSIFATRDARTDEFITIPAELLPESEPAFRPCLELALETDLEMKQFHSFLMGRGLNAASLFRFDRILCSD